MDDELRTLLRTKADRVPPVREVPARMLRRARRRMALRAAEALVVVAAIAVGSLAGVRALSSLGPVPPGNEPSPTFSMTSPPNITPSTTAPATPVDPCTAGDIAAEIDSVEGAAGHRYVTVAFSNRGSEICTMKGRPDLQFLGAGGDPLEVDISKDQRAMWQIDGAPEPDGWPTVTLEPGAKAIAVLDWSVQCGPEVATWRFTLPSGGDVDVPAPADAPGCVASPPRSSINVGPFEPSP